MRLAKEDLWISIFGDYCSRRAVRSLGGLASPINDLCDHVIYLVNALSGLRYRTADSELRFKVCNWIKTMMIFLDLS